jgi:hypothetical protein
MPELKGKLVNLNNSFAGLVNSSVFEKGASISRNPMTGSSFNVHITSY